MYFIEFFFILVGLFQSTFKYAATLSCHTNLKVNLTIMSTQESEGGEDNYEILRQCLKKPCTNLLRKILLKRFNRCDDIVRAIPLEEVSDQTRTALANKSKIKSLHFKVLCDIFQSGVCNGYIGPPAIGWLSPEEEEGVPTGNDSVTDDIIRIWKLWQLHIENNPDETVTDNEFNKALTTLLDIGKRLGSNEDFKELGFEFTKEICCTCKTNPGNIPKVINVNQI